MLKQKTMQYSFEFDRVFDSNDHLSALGWPADDPGFAALSATETKSLLGEGFSAPCIAAVAYAYFLNPLAPWWARKTTAEPS